MTNRSPKRFASAREADADEVVSKMKKLNASQGLRRLVPDTRKNDDAVTAAAASEPPLDQVTGMR